MPGLFIWVARDYAIAMVFDDPFAPLNKLARPLKVACLGECMVELSDLSATDNRVGLGFAGDTLNCAIYLARMLRKTSVEVRYLTALGTDQLSERMIGVMRAEGVGADNVVRMPDRLPGIYAIEVDWEGERSFSYWRSQSAARAMMDPGGLADASILDVDVLALSAISLAILPAEGRQRLLSLCASLKRAGKIVVFDSNYRPALWASADEARQIMSAMWEVTTLALPSRDDEAKLWPNESAETLFQRLDCPEMVLKGGPSGPQVWAGGALPKGQFAKAERVVDTTSAGDAFNAGYLAARLVGKAPAEAAHVGHGLASNVIGEKGAIIPRQAMPPAL